MNIGFLFFVRDSLSIVIAVAIASSYRILFPNPFLKKLSLTTYIDWEFFNRPRVQGFLSFVDLAS